MTILTATLLLAAPSLSRAETVRIGLPTKTYWPTTVAEAAVHQKLFEKEGITAELTIYRGGAECFEALAAGKISMAGRPEICPDEGALASRPSIVSAQLRWFQADRGSGRPSNLASALPGIEKTRNIQASSGVIWGVPAERECPFVFQKTPRRRRMAERPEETCPTRR